jgi:hypothetical protein
MASRYLHLTIAVAAGALVLASFFLRNPVLDAISGTLTGWVTLLVAFGLYLGVWNLARRHAVKVRHRGRDWPHSLVLLGALFAVLALGFWPGSAGPGDPAVSWAYRYVYAPLNATVFSLLAFFVASAAYRMFRHRSMESAVMLIAGIIVLLGQVPLGFQIWSGMPLVKEWLLDAPVASGVRGIVLGVALGTVATGLRILLGQDRPYLGGPKA